MYFDYAFHQDICIVTNFLVLNNADFMTPHVDFSINFTIVYQMRKLFSNTLEL